MGKLIEFRPKRSRRRRGFKDLAPDDPAFATGPVFGLTRPLSTEWPFLPVSAFTLDGPGSHPTYASTDAPSVIDDPCPSGVK